ncbi:hypothetical protein BYT27DRAFT_7180635 [Phlegmacium glaucopus]|nr:hypothetical protein BYT27DRAFT_7180635 [Phlegmacium glaucopus]
MGAGTPSHQNSTKLLINRFEVLGTPPLPDLPPLARIKSTRKQQYVYDYNQPANSLATPDNDKLKLHKKEKSPIRQSIRNLLSVLKKGTSGLSKKSDDKLPVGRQDSTKDSTKESSKPRPSRKKQTGSLLYLTHEQGSLAWTTCNATLEENKIVLASFTSNMELRVHEIVLSHCADIHSLSLVQLGPEDAALLDAVVDSDKMKFFEILFEGGSREKFAAKSVRERAGWISAIWDAILPDQYKDFPAPGAVPDYPKDKRNTETPPPIESPTPTPIPKICALIPSYSDRSLPPLPPKATLPPLTIPPQIPSTPTKFGDQHLHPDTFSPVNTPISPSIYPPTSRPTSSIGSPNPLSPGPISPIESSRPNSPSITNLTQLSVVRHRLAQIERNHSELSTQSVLTTRTSTPVSPSSCSAWSRKEAVWYNPRASPRSDVVTLRGEGNRSPVTPTSHVRRKMRRTETECSLPEDVVITDPLDNILAQHGRPPVSTPTPQRGRGRDQSQDGLEKTTLTPLRQDLTKISKDLSEVKGVLGGASGYPTVHEMVVGLDRRVQGDEQTLRAIQNSLSSLGERVAGVSAVQEQQIRKQDQKQQPVKGGGTEDVQRLLENIQSQLSSVFPSIFGKLTQIADSQEREKEKQQQEQEQVAYRNIGGTPLNTEKTTEMEIVLAKLDEIRMLCPIQVQADSPESTREGDGTKPPEYIDMILTFVDDESQKRSVLMQQQADSVRYLNDLNTWLEAFVNNGTSQIQGLATNIDQLCKELGCNTQQQSGVPRPPGDGPPTLLTDIRQLVLGMQVRDQNFASLQTAVHGLLDVLSASNAQKGADTHAIAGLIDQQRRDQEMLFRAFTDEISGEIKGERLRFVEAMKEATAINVQIHVEQFKQELSREVMSMTEEVGRLHREKQVVESQISDLFAFYTKQKPAAPPLETNYVNGPPARQQQALPLPAQEKPRANIPRSSYHRPLPYPRQL